jgi:hypothetical protein
LTTCWFSAQPQGLSGIVYLQKQDWEALYRNLTADYGHGGLGLHHASQGSGEQNCSHFASLDVFDCG